MILHTCPLRKVGGENSDHWCADGTCSYCGSMHPDTVMALLTAGQAVLGPTDKNYKVYVNAPITDAQLAASKQMWKEVGVGRCVFEAEGEAGYTRWWQAEKHALAQGTHLGKFYFMHLSDKQMTHFIYLFNTSILMFGYPGYFYVMPYFCRPAA